MTTAAPHHRLSELSEQHRRNEAAREAARGRSEYLRSVRNKNRAQKAAYEAGRRGEALPFEGENDELLELYESGAEDGRRAEAEASPKSPGARRQGPTKPSRRPARSSGSTVRATRRAAGAVASGGSLAPLGVIGLMLGLVLLYYLLSNAGAVATAAKGVRSFFTWLLDPHAPVPPTGGGS